MPELPEVETIRRDLKRVITVPRADKKSKRITSVEVRKKRIIKGEVKKFQDAFKSNFFKDIRRIGKLLIFVLGRGDKFMFTHLKMTGQLVYLCPEDASKCTAKIVAGGHGEPKLDKLPSKYSHVIFNFADGSRLFFNDLRQFGYLEVVNKDRLKQVENDYGVGPLTSAFSFQKLKKILASRKAPIKAILLNQKLIAGIGNIYADEILFAARVRPQRSAGSLNDKEIKKIFKATPLILKKAIKYRGTTFNNYVDSSGRRGNFSQKLKVYGRAGGKCRGCAGVVKKIKLAGRGTHYCPECQQ